MWLLEEKFRQGFLILNMNYVISLYYSFVIFNVLNTIMF